MKYETFDPRPTDEAREKNDALFSEAPAGVLGIEVTVPALASQCDLGHLDHHGPDCTEETPSACEQALALEGGDLPPTDAVLVTVRADADSVTAMAVIATRLAGKVVDADLVSMIGAFDRLGPRAKRRDDRVTAIIRVACDFKQALGDRVAWIGEMLAGDNKSAEVAELVAARNREFEEARKASTIKIAADGRIAVVESHHRFATTLGYEEAAIVVALNPEMPVDFKDPSAGSYKKFTVCRYNEHVPVDISAILNELNELEAGWGGRGDIIGSPQQVSSTLTIDEVVTVVKRHLK